MSENLWIEIIKIIPNLLWVIISVIALMLFYKPIVKRLLPKVKELKLFGIEAAFFQQTLRKASEIKHKKITPQDEAILLNRIQSVNIELSNKSVLWIDDRPERSSIDRNLLSTIGLKVEVATNSEEGLKQLKENKFDLIVSDIVRDENKTEGLDFLKRLRSLEIFIPTIFYLEFYKPEKGTPPFAFGITNEPKELIHLVLDLIQRKY
jgi:CheY-like chemotaxis protein